MPLEACMLVYVSIIRPLYDVYDDADELLRV